MDLDEDTVLQKVAKASGKSNTFRHYVVKHFGSLVERRHWWGVEEIGESKLWAYKVDG